MPEPRKLEEKRERVERFARRHEGGVWQCSKHPRLSEMTTARALAALKTHTRLVVSRPWFCDIIDGMRPRVKRRATRGPDAMDASDRNEGAKSRMRARYRKVMRDPKKHRAYRKRKNAETAKRRAGG